jgi:hypothetical protein
MTDAECRAIEQKCVEKVRKALKTITSGEIYDGRGYLNEKGYKALEEIEGLDLFWICDPLIKLAKESDEEKIQKIIDDLKKKIENGEVYLAPAPVQATVPILIHHSGKTFPGYNDTARKLIFASAISEELAEQFGWTWEEAEEQKLGG